jgi:hypothetical protein
MTVIRWQDIDPADAKDIDLRKRDDIIAPLNEAGQRCPWPWEPQQRDPGEPGTLFKCPHCGAHVFSGEEHVDYAFVPADWHRAPDPRTAGRW